MVIGQIDGDVMMFELSAKEKESLDKWLKKHNKKCPFKDTNQRLITYMFTPTGIGTIKEIRCSCGKKIDVTDSSVW